MTAPKTALISVQSLSKTFVRTQRQKDQSRVHKALDKVNFVMERPERVALIGPSGSGKSTLLRHISGLMVADKGSGPITVLGKSVQADGRLSADVKAARTELGVIAQQFNLVGRLSLFTNVALGLLGRISFWRGLFGRWNADEKHAIMSALAQVKVAEQAGQRANTLSGGQQQRGAIARAIVQDAKIVLADEPIASLDPVTARKVMKLLVDLNETKGVGVVVTLHQVDYAKAYCDRILALKNGQVVFDGKSADLSDTILREIYGEEFEDAYWGGA